MCSSSNIKPSYDFQHGRGSNLQEVVNLRKTQKDEFPLYIGSVASVRSGPFWVTVENTKESLIYSRQYDPHGQLLEERSLPLEVSGFHSISSFGNVYYFNKGNDSIELINKDGETQVIQCLKELGLNKGRKICGLYTNFFDVIFLAISYKLNRGTIVRLNINSGTINTIDIDSRGKPLYESPRCTDENTHGILCTVDVKGIVLFQLSTNEKIPCVEVPHPRTVVTNFYDQFLVCYGPEMCPLFGIINGNGEMLKKMHSPWGEIELMCCDAKDSLLIVTNNGSDIKRISLNRLQSHNDP